MGQYYNPCVLSSDKNTVIKSAKCYDFDNGAKLMEHSYVGNTFVNAFCALIDADAVEGSGLLNGSCVGQPVVWCGDYADNLDWTLRKENGKEVGDNYYSLADGKYITVSDVEPVNRRYAINQTKKEYVDLFKAPEIEGWGAQIHALPLLTAFGNGRGGGDYCGSAMQLVGRWACDVVVVSDTKPEGYSELVPNFVEGETDDDSKALEDYFSSNGGEEKPEEKPEAMQGDAPDVPLMVKDLLAEVRSLRQEVSELRELVKK